MLWTVVLEKTLESPLDQKEIWPVSSEYSLERLMLKLKLQYFDHLMWRADSLEKTLMWERLKAEEEGDGRGWGGWMESLMWWTWVWVGSSHWWWIGKPGVLQSEGSQRFGHDLATELNWYFRNSLRIGKKKKTHYWRHPKSFAATFLNIAVLMKIDHYLIPYKKKISLR